ncbi:MAG: hypothetical protein J5918_07975 [Prevotella sp.]|nr:hypothetical protein [Prevotella sp.]
MIIARTFVLFYKLIFFLTLPFSHLINSGHSIGLHRGDELAKEDKAEAGEGLNRRMVGMMD